MIEVKKEFSKSELMWFGPLFAVFTGIIAAILIRRLGWHEAAKALCVAAALLIILYYMMPAAQTRIYRGWLLSVAPIGFVVSHLLLLLVFYLVLTPIGLLMRLGGYDPLARRFDRQASSYWIPRAGDDDARRYLRQY